MVHWIKRMARILAVLTFLIVFVTGLDPSQPLDPHIVTIAFFKGFLGAVLFWFAGFILGDIVLKGLITAIPTQEDDAIDGGLIQRVYNEQKRSTPAALVQNGAQTEKGRSMKQSAKK
jgi:hypothetical protein